ncbi:hypothetical protein ACQPZJ_28225 [Actinoplanes sp. CA-054009]
MVSVPLVLGIVCRLAGAGGAAQTFFIGAGTVLVMRLVGGAWQRLRGSR